MSEIYSRNELLIGREAQQRLRDSSVAVFGIGGVGGHLVEALARAGVGKLLLVDCDSVSASNINRQIIALHSTVGRAKTEAMCERIADIDPSTSVVTKNVFVSPDNISEFDLLSFDYVADAIDTLSGKLAIITECLKYNTPVISAMGAGNKLDPTGFRVADISKTFGCPLARSVRCELRKRGVTSGVKTVFSEEKPVDCSKHTELSEGGRHTPGSISFMPSVMGLIMASEIIKDLALR